MTSTEGLVARKVILRPQSTEKRDKILKLLQALPDNQRSADCTAWCYLTPATREGAILAPFQDVRTPLIAGVEIYASPSALSNSRASSFSTDYNSRIKKDDLYAEDEEESFWYPVGGFVARPSEQNPGKAGLILLASFVAQEGDGKRDQFIEVLNKYAAWLFENDPTTLSYSAMTSPEVPNEIFLLERYKDSDALKSHVETEQFKTMYADIWSSQETRSLIDPKQTVLS
ncbi:hypothetical protein BKA56DRAFT_625888 [Ilyonectria sp. MPI-CAGE-AT-0026]|nr:hypothetical protein BKA56DRAFT_625888 [Ilyonectria sp. MPI-CAGE-AT-0026]